MACRFVAILLNFDVARVETSGDVIATSDGLLHVLAKRMNIPR